MQIRGHQVNIIEQKIVPVEIRIEEGRISSITPVPADTTGPFILPGFVDSHVHIESSLLVPSEFARLAVVHGTIATVSDPHEIANVCGLPGVEFMIRNGNSVPFYFNFGAPSCVPATIFETAGATIDAAAVTALLEKDDIKYLSEVMNFPGVINKDPEVMGKIAAARQLGKPVDGHAPGLNGEDLKKYIAAGITTDHEAFTYEEALEKLRLGMKILIREGSAARNFEALIPLLNDYPEQIMFCSDDKHPDSLLAGHIDRLCARAAAKGIDVYKILRAACINPVAHYNLEHGQLKVGDPADFIVVEDLTNFHVLQTFIKGVSVASNGTSHLASTILNASPAPTSSGGMLSAEPINNFKARPHVVADFAYLLNKWGEEENVEQCYCIEALDGQLITNRLIIPIADTLPGEGHLNSNPEKDILKIVVVNRYNAAPVAKSFIKGFGLKRGAIASSVAHDSHNIVAIGVDDESICRAVNLIIDQKGGLSCVDPGKSTGATTAGTSAPGTNTPAPSDITGEPIQIMAAAGAELILPLPVAGLMSLDDGYRVAEAYTAIDHMAKELGATLAAPFMTLSFMALLVIPHLKLGDLGLFDGDAFRLL
jgi:adenine deaminase